MSDANLKLRYWLYFSYGWGEGAGLSGLDIKYSTDSLDEALDEAPKLISKTEITAVHLFDSIERAELDWEELARKRLLKQWSAQIGVLKFWYKPYMHSQPELFTLSALNDVSGLIQFSNERVVLTESLNRVLDIVAGTYIGSLSKGTWTIASGQP